jgi:DNA/RNA-binding domain of Phe-tRNA-synthetase-like protein
VVSRYFQHAPAVWAAHPDLVAGAVYATGLTATVPVAPELPVEPVVARYLAIARARLAGGTEADGTEAKLPEIQAWRRAFGRMGLKPTQYRCASESLLRRLRKEGDLPRIHPLIDLCNAISVAFAIPVAALDASRIAGDLRVRPATGDERYLAFSGEVEHPEPGELVFADAGGEAHARRWTHRQSGHSAVRADTTSVLIVAEAMHDSAPSDVPKLVAAVADELSALWSVTPSMGVLSEPGVRFTFPLS